MKLKGEENYIIQKEVIEDLAIINRLKYFIYEKGKVLKYVDRFNKKANEVKLTVWLVQETKDLSIKIIIKLNIKSIFIQMLAGCKLVYKIWVTL